MFTIMVDLTTSGGMAHSMCLGDCHPSNCWVSEKDGCSTVSTGGASVPAPSLLFMSVFPQSVRSGGRVELGDQSLFKTISLF